MAFPSKRQFNLMDHMALFGFGLAVLYWLLEALVYVLLSENAGFVERLTGPRFDDLFIRILVLCFFAIFGSHAQYTINQRRQAEAALRESEEKYRTIIESIEDGYYEVDTDGRLVFCNSALSRILGHNEAQIIGSGIHELLGAENGRALFDRFNALRHGETTLNELDWSFRHRDGSERFIETAIILMKSAKGRITGFRGLLRDITRRKLAEAMYREKLAAEAANRSKSEFLANMSHEIRTPLNSIIGLVELMLETDLSSEQREDLGVVNSAAYALLSLINDILDFSKIEAGKLELEELPFNVRDFLGDSLRIVAGKAHEKGIELAYRVGTRVPEILVGDPSRLRQVVLNLVGNAVKFTDAGEIILSVAAETGSESDVGLLFSVTDTGVGIPREKQESIFGAFAQADGSTSRRYGGTGLGLAVSSQLVGLMQGRIWVESPVKAAADRGGPGSAFYFTARFRTDRQRETDLDRVPRIEIKSMKTLIVDDNRSHLDILREMLEGWGLSADTAASMEAGQAFVLAAMETETSYGLIIIDADMPVNDGFTLLSWIKTQSRIDPAVIMMLTPLSGRPRKDLNGLNVSAVVQKPVRPSDLLDAVVHAVVPAETLPDKAAPASDPPDHAAPGGLAILVAEDTPFNQKFIHRLLDRWQHRTTIVENGLKAVEMISRKRFDLILMDVQMPEMDGFEATAAIRELEKTAGGHTPIIAMTAHAMRGDRERCLRAGMDDYVPKPIHADALAAAIARLVPAAEAPAAEKDGDKMGAPFQLDKDIVLKAFDNDWDFFKEVVEMFVEDYPRMMVDIQEAVNRRDGPRLQRTAHAIKGMLGNFQVKNAVGRAFELEKMGRDQAFDDAQRIYEMLADELRQLEAFFRKMTEEGRI